MSKFIGMIFIYDNMAIILFLSIEIIESFLVWQFSMRERLCDVNTNVPLISVPT